MSNQARGYPSTAHATQLLPNGLVPGGHHLVPVETLSRSSLSLSNHMLPSASQCITLQGNHLQSHSRGIAQVTTALIQFRFTNHDYSGATTALSPSWCICSTFNIA